MWDYSDTFLPLAQTVLFVVLTTSTTAAVQWFFEHYWACNKNSSNSTLYPSELVPSLYDLLIFWKKIYEGTTKRRKLLNVSKVLRQYGQTVRNIYLKGFEFVRLKYIWSWTFPKEITAKYHNNTMPLKLNEPF